MDVVKPMHNRMLFKALQLRALQQIIVESTQSYEDSDNLVDDMVEASTTSESAAAAATSKLPNNSRQSLRHKLRLLSSLFTFAEIGQLLILDEDVETIIQSEKGISDDKSSKSKTQQVHVGYACDRSDMDPIVGVRWHKRNENYDLCESIPKSATILAVGENFTENPRPSARTQYRTTKRQ